MDCDTSVQFNYQSLGWLGFEIFIVRIIFKFQPAPRWPVLDMVSGDFHGADGIISFESVSLR